VTERQASRIFGKRATRHTIIIASGDRIRHMTVKPWAIALAGGIAATLLVSYLAATAYLVLRDDLIGATMARQARMQHAYEDRIAALRAQVDRVTSRQLLDQQLMEDKVQKLIAHQEALSSRHGRLGALLERAEINAIGDIDAPLPTPKPDTPEGPGRQASAANALDAISLVTGAVPNARRSATTDAPEAALLAYAPLRPGNADEADQIFGELTLSLRLIERDQFRKVRDLTSDAFQTADAIEHILRRTGIEPPAAARGEGVGGPLIEDDPVAFDASIDELDLALTRLEDVRRHAARMPLSHPAPGKKMTSRYGTRKDPFIRRTAFHSGADFRLGYGEAVIATGGGRVIAAGRNGGYGKMVDIDHGQGIVTRYAHLSEIEVQEGQVVARGERIGEAGSTGRSTGPHLHYEVRRDDRPVDPVRFIEAARSLEPLMTSRETR
jgi:murein DD-endopeptidase MepM/ murein hydrolase activator NlpD